MLEFLVVSFSQRRKVFVNGEFMGHTEDLLELEGGLYVVTLGPPPDFTPIRHLIDLHGTSAFTPMKIEFEEI